MTGDFVYKVTHPKHEISKTYNVTVVGKITTEEVDKLKNGVDIGGFTTNKAEVRILKIDEIKNISRLQITIHEGKNRQIRKMADYIGYPVIYLKRVMHGPIDLSGLKKGQFKYLKPQQIKELKAYIKKIAKS